VLLRALSKLRDECGVAKIEDPYPWNTPYECIRALLFVNAKRHDVKTHKWFDDMRVPFKTCTGHQLDKQWLKIAANVGFTQGWSNRFTDSLVEQLLAAVEPANRSNELQQLASQRSTKDEL
jgi:hypothetical protein